MPHVQCPRCQRANPSEAVYCYFDGVVLRQGPGPGGAAATALEFVFPSGRRCRNFDDLVRASHEEWEDARKLLRKGAYAKFLAGVGRLDLARIAQEAQTHPDPDIGLHNFLDSLPAREGAGPRLDLNPRRLNLGALRAGETRQVRLLVLNQGNGVLQGKLSVTEGGGWLRVVEAADGECAVKTDREQAVSLRVDTRSLPAPQSYSGKLTVITNGGIAEVPVRMDVGVHPFPRPPFVGVSSPREMAERMRTQPKQAVALLESGDIQRWFDQNGWAYPVQGPTARGVAAVQQFFEAMGLSRPPQLGLSETELHILATPPEVLQGQVSLRTSSRKWVYAQVESDAAWMRVLTPLVSGAQQADIQFEVDASLADPGIHDGTLTLLANAGQRLIVRVRLEVQRPHEPFTRRLLKPFFMGLLLGLVYRVVLAAPADVFARALAVSREQREAAPSLASWGQSPIFGEGPSLRLEYIKFFVLATWWLGALAGAVLLWQRGSRRSDVLFGAVAGAVGLAGMATLACFLDLVDGLPRLIVRGLEGRLDGQGSAGRWLAVWISLAAVCWGLLGGAVGFLLRLAGRPGMRLLGWLGAPLAWGCRACGLQGPAAFFALQGT